MPLTLAWERLIRFIATDGRVLRGEPLSCQGTDLDPGRKDQDTPLKARVLSGSDIYDVTGKTKLTDEIVTVNKLLGPLTQDEVPIIRCIGLNYATHIREAGRRAPPFPSMFFKPSTTVVGHGDLVVIPKIAQDSQADYEGELCVILGRDAKDVSVENALEYVAGYTAGNDISSRKLQRDPALAGNVPQWGFSKGFDTYAPLGPILVSAKLIPKPETLQLQTRIGGQLRQDTSIQDLVFSIPYLISYLSSGTTLKKGSIIMTGTPGGVGAGLTPPQYLTPGTEMEVYISEIGTLRNMVAFSD
ncbi:Fumarylacetoacetase, protein [Akanthomyces lecanii RCEF 1005]|uniref:Fumarylacetoacetase, protein n=1 Tax=Akanthomyces lecanii RCEF 1005 TaxID=1081108 RepID=A0A168G7F4_CORDF|nr:Fumarylacetoacetase, protein [Akanthomyces lecanii RCEF 1005]